jgi:N-acetylneuraminate synthase
MVKKLEFSQDDFRYLFRYCESRGIQFLSTAFDIPSLKFLTEELQQPLIKIPSGDVLNGPLLLAAARTGKEILLSTGMCRLGDIEQALGVLAFGFLDDGTVSPSHEVFQNTFSREESWQILKSRVSLLHCTTEYPAPYTDVNLMAMQTLRTAFDVPIGISDHSMGIEVPIGAVALGATVVEKHFTLDRDMEGPDHNASLSPDDLASMISAIRNISLSLGDGLKFPRQSEIKNIEIARKYIVAARPIKAGQVIAEGDIIAKRATAGISPIFYWDIVGSISDRDYVIDDVIVAVQ